MSQQLGGVSGSCGSNLGRGSAYGSSVRTFCHPRLAECKPDLWRTDHHRWCATGLMTVATILLDFAGLVPACVLLSPVLSAVTEGCWGFTLQTFPANKTVRVKCSLPRGKPLGTCEDHLVMNLQKYYCCYVPHVIVLRFLFVLFSLNEKSIL